MGAARTMKGIALVEVCAKLLLAVTVSVVGPIGAPLGTVIMQEYTPLPGMTSPLVPSSYITWADGPPMLERSTSREVMYAPLQEGAIVAVSSTVSFSAAPKGAADVLVMLGLSSGAVPKSISTVAVPASPAESMVAFHGLENS